jgi:hypothetical protein
MIYWIMKLVMLIVVLIVLIWIKYFFAASFFKTLYNQFYFLKNVSFYNAYLASEMWMTTQRLNMIANPTMSSAASKTLIVSLWDQLFKKLDDYTFIFQFSDLMVIDEEFRQFYDVLLNEDNCMLIANTTVSCDDPIAKEIFANSYRSSMAFSFALFKKFQLILKEKATVDVFKTHIVSITDFATLTSIVYKYLHKKHRDSGYLHRKHPTADSPVPE